jgi:hypothetical protein
MSQISKTVPTAVSAMATTEEALHRPDNVVRELLQTENSPIFLA